MRTDRISVEAVSLSTCYLIAVINVGTNWIPRNENNLWNFHEVFNVLGGECLCSPMVMEDGSVTCFKRFACFACFTCFGWNRWNTRNGWNSWFRWLGVNQWWVGWCNHVLKIYGKMISFFSSWVFAIVAMLSLRNERIKRNVLFPNN